jgi:hypothetical protein
MPLRILKLRAEIADMPRTVWQLRDSGLDDSPLAS